MEGLLHLLYRVSPSDQIKGFLLHGLGINGNSGNAPLHQNSQFLFRDAVRSSRFHRKFLYLGKIKRILKLSEKPVKLLRLQRSGRASADIDRIQYFIFINLCGKIDFLFQCGEIIIYPLFP